MALGSPESVEILADVGLGFLFLLAGYEVDQRLLRADTGRRAALSWLVTAALAGGIVGLLYAVGLVRAFVPVAVALTTTALGTLLPILREHHLLGGRLGPHLLAAGAVTAVAFGLTLLSRSFRVGRIRTIIEEGEHETTQVTVRGTVLLLTLLLAVTVPAQLLYRRVLDPRERWQQALITSTALPLLVAISEIGLRNGTMLPANAAALVGAGVLTVLVFPAVAVVLRRPPIVSDAPVP